MTRMGSRLVNKKKNFFILVRKNKKLCIHADMSWGVLNVFEKNG